MAKRVLLKIGPIDNFQFEIKSFSKPIILIGCGHTWDLKLVKGFNRGKKEGKKLYYSKTH